MVRPLSNGEDVGRTLVPPLANVQLHGAEGVDGEPLVGVDGDTEETGVGVDQLVLVSDDGVPQDAGVSEVRQVRHVVGAVKLWGVDLADEVLLVDLHLPANIDRHFGSILRLDESFQETPVSLVRNLKEDKRIMKTLFLEVSEQQKILTQTDFFVS